MRARVLRVCVIFHIKKKLSDRGGATLGNGPENARENVMFSGLFQCRK